MEVDIVAEVGLVCGIFRFPSKVLQGLRHLLFYGRTSRNVVEALVSMVTVVVVMVVLIGVRVGGVDGYRDGPIVKIRLLVAVSLGGLLVVFLGVGKLAFMVLWFEVLLLVLFGVLFHRVL